MTYDCYNHYNNKNLPYEVHTWWIHDQGVLCSILAVPVMSRRIRIKQALIPHCLGPSCIVGYLVEQEKDTWLDFLYMYQPATLLNDLQEGYAEIEQVLV